MSRTLYNLSTPSVHGGGSNTPWSAGHPAGMLGPARAPTTMNKPLSFALVVGGIILITYGVSASDSKASGISRFFTGNPTDKTMWLLIGGAVAIAIGVVGLLRGSKAP